MSLPSAFRFAAAALVLVPGFAPITYHFGVSPQRTNITFESRADVETILGSTMDLAGEAVFDEEAGTVRCDLSVAVDSLRTGIPLRDEHLRSDAWLDAKKHPTITFKATSSRRKEGADNVLVVEGDFTMKGKTRPLTVDVKFRKISAETAKKSKLEEGEWVRFSTSFPVKLADHDVRIPDGVGPKVAETWTVKFEAYASTVKKKA